MTTATIDILDDNALNLLKDLKLLKVIRIKNDDEYLTQHSTGLA